MYLVCAESYTGHCALCKDVLCFKLLTFKFCVFAFVFCVPCVVGRTCGPTPLLVIHAIKYVYTNIPFPCSSGWR